MGGKTFKFLFMIVLGSVTLLFPNSIFAASPQKATEGLLTFEVQAGEAVLSRCDTEAQGTVRIPEQVQGYPVKAIGEDAFYFCERVTQVELPASVEEIGQNAFFRCFALEEVVLPEGLKKIGDGAFSFCALKEIQLPASLEYLGDGAFYGIKVLEKIQVPVESKCYAAQDGVLFNQTKTTLICYPSGKRGAFYRVPPSVSRVKAYAFAGNSALLLVQITEETVLEENAVFRCPLRFKISSKESSVA